MSREMVMKFWAQADREGALRDEMKALLGAQRVIPAAEIVALGGRHGYTFTPADLQASLAAGGELTESDLDRVAGGFFCEINGKAGGYLSSFMDGNPDRPVIVQF